MKKELKAIAGIRMVAMLMVVTAFLPAPLNAGNLEPSGLPGPTMKTLDEIYQAITPLPTGFVLWENNPRFAVSDNNTPADTSDDVVLDRATELMWTRDTNIDGRKNWQEANDYCDTLSLGHRKDWRLPSLEEILSLKEPYPPEHSPALPSGHPFINVQLNYYWSSTPHAGVPGRVWVVHFGNYNVGYGIKTNLYYVWCVRGRLESSGPPEPTIATWSQKITDSAERFELVLDGEGVLDKETGLVWEQSPDDTIDGNWYEACRYCYRKEVGGRKGWRLPTAEELASLVDQTNTEPALPTGHPFDVIPWGTYWTSTTVAFSPDRACGVKLLTGDVAYDHNDYYKTYYHDVWCVRGGYGHDAY